MADGTEQRDIFNGLFFDDEYHGLGGNDDIFGLGGNDSLFGNGGNDLIKGGEGDDRLFGGGDNDVLISGEREPFASKDFPGYTLPDGGDDELDGGSGNDLLIVTFDSGDVEVDGGDGIDGLRMGFDNAALQEFLDLFPPALQTDPSVFTATIDLAAGTGKYRFNGTTIAVDLTIDDIENIDGSAFSETLFGDANANVINASGGNDVVEGRGGADRINGGAGRDRASYASSSAAVDVDLTRTIQIGGHAQGDQLTSIADLTGSSFSDVLRGNSGSNNLVGGAGNDTLEGRAGADTIDGGSGNDTASYQSSNAAVNVDLTRATQIGGHAQGDALTSIERVIGSEFNDTLIGSSGNNFLTGGNGIDTLIGRDGNDMLIGGFGNDVLDGGNGTDTASFETASAEVTVVLQFPGSADGQAIHGGEVDTLRSIERAIGSQFRDTFFGNSAGNRFDGENGDDIFHSSPGNDAYLGGDGIDTVSYFSETLSNIVVTVSGFTFVSRTGGPTDFLDTLIDVEQIVGTRFDDQFTSGVPGIILAGSGGNDTYNISNNSVAVVEFVGGGNDTINTSVNFALAPDLEIEALQASNPGQTTDITLHGNEFANTIIGARGGDLLDGLAGADTLFGLDGNDVLHGGEGDDQIFGGAGNDNYLAAGPGNDIFIDASGNDIVLFFFNNIESIFRSGNDLIADLTDGVFTVVNHFNGQAIESALDLSTGDVVTLAVGLTGGDAPGIIAGTDRGETLDGRGGGDFLYGNGGRDVLLGGDGNDLLDGGKGRDRLDGGKGRDRLDGGVGDDTLLGGDGNDLLDGGKGHDRLDGGAGDDTLIGGKGRDVFVFAPDSGHDVILDFEQGRDRIDLRAFDTRFRSLDDDRDGRLERGEGNDQIAVTRDGGDLLLSFAEGSIRIADIKVLDAGDLIL